MAMVWTGEDWLAVVGESSTIDTVVLFVVAEFANAAVRLPDVKFCACVSNGIEPRVKAAKASERNFVFIE